MKKSTALALVLALTACAHTGAGLPPVSGSSLGAPPSAKSRTGSARFTIVVPKRRRHVRGHRYVSPATQSLTISIVPAQGGTPVVSTANVTAGAAEIAVSLKSGAYVATLTTYDAPGETGNVLSTGQNLPFTIVAGQQNNVALTLGGVPSTLSITPEGNATGSQAAGFTVPGSAAQYFAVLAKDADGYAIVGAGAPTYTTTIGSGTGWSVTKQTTSQDPNEVLVTPPGTNGAAASIKISISDPDICALAGAACSVTFGVTNAVQHLYVAIVQETAGANDEIAIFDAPYAGTPSATISSGVNRPIDVKVDPSGNVFVLNDPQWYNNGSMTPSNVTKYAASNGYANPVATISLAGLSYSNHLAVDAADDVFVTGCSQCNDPSDPEIWVYTASNYGGTPVEIGYSYAEIKNILATPQGTLIASVCSDSCSGYTADAVYQYAPPYTESPRSISQDGALSIAFDPAGNLWAGECGPCSQVSVVGRHDPDPTVPGYFSLSNSVIATTTNDVYQPEAMALDAKGDLFVSNGSAGGSLTEGIWEIPPPNYTAPVKLSLLQNTYPEQMAVDGEGNLIFDIGNSEVDVSAPPFSSYSQLVGSSGSLNIGLGHASSFALSP